MVIINLDYAHIPPISPVLNIQIDEGTIYCFYQRFRVIVIIGRGGLVTVVPIVIAVCFGGGDGDDDMYHGKLFLALALGWGQCHLELSLMRRVFSYVP